MRSTRLAFVALVVISLGAACGDDDGTATSTTTRPPAETTTSTAPPTTSTTTTVPSTQPVVWPLQGGTPAADPVSAARGFATEVAGFSDPVLGEFQQGDSRSGEIEVRGKAGPGPVSTLFVRQVGSDDRWSVIGAASANLQLATPATGDAVASPVHFTGQSTAFEATILLGVRDLAGNLLAQTNTMGGSNGEMGPFDATLAFDRQPATPTGIAMLWNVSMEDGGVSEVSAVPVRFG